MHELEFGDALGEVGDYVGFGGAGNGGGVVGWGDRASAATARRAQTEIAAVICAVNCLVMVWNSSARGE